MKNFMLVALFVIGFSGLAFAGEFERNPDRFPSIGLTLSLAGESGTATVKQTGFSANQNISSGSGSLVVDLRAPVSNSLTLFGAIGLTGSSLTADETNLLSGQDIRGGGFILSVGIRYYMNR